MPKKIPWKAPTLNEVLASVGFSTSPADFGAKKILDKDGQELFCGGAGEVWQWLRDEGHHFSQCRDCCREHAEVELDISGTCEDCYDALARIADRERRIAAYESRGDHMRDMQKGAL